MFRLAMVTFGDYTLFIYRLFLIDPTAVLAISLSRHLSVALTLIVMLVADTRVM